MRFRANNRLDAPVRDQDDENDESVFGHHRKWGCKVLYIMGLMKMMKMMAFFHTPFPSSPTPTLPTFGLLQNTFSKIGIISIIFIIRGV
jgi:hypothetical protein